jgi:signal transduction histidine kinase
MFAIVSHDLRQPVTVIQLYAKIAEQSMNQADHSDDLTKEAVVQIDIAVQKMSKMIEELMDVAALQVDQPLDLERQWTDLVGLARRVVGAYQYSTRAHTLRLVTDEPQIIGFIDENRIDRTIANLVDNAIKYSPTGGGILVQITHEQDEHDTWATLEVQDQGLGIPAQDLPQIFTRFYRASNIPKRINGNGIGLASAQQIVEQHGGTIAVTSCEGEGTTFTVRLPLMRQQP